MISFFKKHSFDLLLKKKNQFDHANMHTYENVSLHEVSPFLFSKHSMMAPKAKKIINLTLKERKGGNNFVVRKTSFCKIP